MNFVFKNKSRLVFAVLVCLFIWSRLWNISNTLEFFSDMGRDHWVLWQMVAHKKPTLLGPSNSVLPLNQSPVYYYLNLPVFLVSGQSPYTTILTLTALFVVSFTLGFWILQRDSVKSKIFLCVVSLSMLHPLFLEQTRSSWNPTFAFPFLLMSFALLLEKRMNEWKRQIVFAFGLAIAVGCTYSVIPVAFLLGFYALWCHNQYRRQIFFALFAAFALIFSPLVLFEIKSHGIVTSQLIRYAHASHQSEDLSKKLYLVLSNLGGSKEFSLLHAGIALVVIFMSGIFAKKKFLFVGLFLSLSIMVVGPFPMAPHYVFGVALFFFALVASLPTKVRVLTFVVFLFLWIPSDWSQLHAIPHRTVREMDACAKQICADHPSAMYLSEQAWHSYHYSPDWLFLFSKHGCKVADVTTTPNFSDRMAVVVDNSSFEFGKTAYNELTLFGPSTLENTLECPGNVAVTFIKRQ